MGESNKLIRLDPNKLAGLELDSFAPYPSETILSGTSEHERWQFDHGELFVGAYQAKPAKLTLEDYPYDEFMYLLSGRIDITNKDGNLQSFLPGQALVLKKGFTGTFEMIGNVRKIAIVAGEQYSPPK